MNHAKFAVMSLFAFNKMDKEDRRLLSTFGGIGFELPLSILVGFFVGRYLDSLFGTTYLEQVGLGVGFAAAIRALIRITRLARKEMVKETLDEDGNYDHGEYTAAGEYTAPAANPPSEVAS